MNDININYTNPQIIINNCTSIYLFNNYTIPFVRFPTSPSINTKPYQSPFNLAHIDAMILDIDFDHYLSRELESFSR